MNGQEHDSITTSEDGVGRTLVVFYGRLAWKWRKWLVGVWAVVTAVSLLFYWAAPPLFEASVLIAPGGGSSGDSTLNKLSAMLGPMMPALPGGESSTVRFLDILESERVLDGVAERCGLGGDGRSRNAVRQQLKKRAEFELTKGDLIKINVVAETPEEAAAIANGFVAELEEVCSERRTANARRERAFLEGRLKEVLADLKAVQREWREFQEKHRLVRVDDGLQATAAVIGELEARRIAKQVELDVAKRFYASGSTEIKMLRAEVKGLEAKLESVSSNGVESPSQEDSSSRLWLFPPVESIPELAIEQMDLQRRLALHSKLFELLSMQLEVARMSEAREQHAVEVISPAVPPDVPSGPGPASALGRAGLLVFAGFLVVGFGVFTDPALSRRILEG